MGVADAQGLPLAIDVGSASPIDPSRTNVAIAVRIGSLLDLRARCRALNDRVHLRSVAVERVLDDVGPTPISHPGKIIDAGRGSWP